MKMRRVLAFALLMAMALTSLGFGPALAAQTGGTSEDDAIVAQWTNKEDLTLADQEIALQAQKGTLSEDSEDIATKEEKRYQASDIVTVIVELEEDPLLDYINESEDSIQDFAASARGQELSKALRRTQEDVKAQMQALSGAVSTQSVNGASHLEYSYTTVFNGFSMRLRYGDLERAREIAGVKRVFVAEQYDLPATQDANESSISMATSSGMVGAPEANAMGYDGTGTIVAILDTGMDTDHEAFSVMPTGTKYTKSDVAAALRDKLACGVTDVNQVYVSEKIPFGYDYADGDPNTEADIDHGVHVAGTVAGNNGKDFKGVAPNAQLMVMKVFANGSGSTGDDIILAALDDAVKLGADSVNLSLGSPAGFAEYGDEDGAYTYYGVYTRAQAAGVSVLVAAGNETSSSYQNPRGNNLTLAQYPDNAIVATPSTLPVPLSVASVDNVSYLRNQFLLGETKIPYNGGVDYTTQVETNILDTFEGKTVEYVVIPGLGEESDFEGLDLTNKIALIKRGTLNFDEKAANAAAKGAVAAIIYNNGDDGLYYAALQTHSIPVITIARDSAEQMIAAQDKSIRFSAAYYGIAKNPAGGQMSSFSSLGPAPNLTLKPEITAPGGNIYSSVIGGGYQSMGGTSMATPHMAGIAADLRQYLQETYPNLSAEELSDLCTSLLMSTAVPAVDQGSGTYFATRRQGAGVANVAHAILSEAYLSVEGSSRPKAEVGSSKDGTFSYTATVHNLSGAAKTYCLDTAVLAETVTGLEGTDLTFVANSEKRLSSSEVDVAYTGLTNGKITVPADGKASFTVRIALTEAGKKYLNDNFENGTYVEGYTFLTTEDDGGISLSLPFLGFYGDWGSLDVFDADPSGDPNMLGTALADVDTAGSGYFLGMNTTTGVYNESKMAFGPKRGNRQMIARVSLLRNVDSFEETVTDAQGNLIYTTGDLGQFRKTYATVTMTGVQYTTVTYAPGWFGRTMKDGVNDAGDWVEDGKWYTYTIKATPNGSQTPQTKEFKFYLDNTKPTVEDVKLYEEDGKVYLTCLAGDDFYLQRLRVLDSTQQYYYLVAAEEFDAISKTGAKVRVTFDVTELAAALAADGKNPGRVGLLLEDAAYNQNLVFVDIGPQSMTLESTSVKVGESKQIAVSIKPDRMADSKLTWASYDKSIATVDQNGVVTGVADGETMVTATAVSGLTAYAKITVGKGTPVYLTYGEAPELNDRFQTDDGFCWKVIGPDTVQLVHQNGGTGTGYPDLSGEIAIPATVEHGGKTFRVTSIGYKAFNMNMNITSVVIPDGVTAIGESAFWFCRGITSMQLPDSVERIDKFGLAGVNAPLNIPRNLKWIGDEAFSQVPLTRADLPEGLTHIGNKVFNNCKNLATASIPESVTEYGSNIFLYCTALTYVELPGNLTEIPENMLYGATALKRIQIPDGVTKIGDGAFYGSGLEKLTIPSSVKEIGDWAFAWLTDMKEINIPDTVERIGFSAYIYSKGVKTVNIGSGVKRIGMDAFHTWNVDLGEPPVMNVKTEEAATALRRSGYGQEILLGGVPYTGYNGVQFTDGMFSYMPISDTEVQVVGFNDQTGDTDIVMPATVYCEGDDRTYTVTSINSRVFFQNQSVRKLTLPDTIENMGERAFDQMFNVCEVNVPKNLKNVGYQAMGYFGWDGKSLGLTFQTETLEIPGSVEVWDDCGFAGNQHKTIVVGEGVTYIGNYGLFGCYNATSVTLPSTLKRIGNDAFNGCKSLTAIEIPDSVTYIDDGAFATVPLASIELPQGLEYIGSKALGSQTWNSDYTAMYWVGPENIVLNGSLKKLGWDSFRPDAEVVAVLNSQRNMVVEYGNMEKLPTVIWDGKTDIPYNDGSCVPKGVTVTVSGDVTIRGKLTVEGKLVLPAHATLRMAEDAVLVGEENIVYEHCDGKTDCPSFSFPDLDTTAWYHEYTDYVIAREMMNGYENGTFGPNRSVTRAMVITTLYRMAGSPAATASATFTDVKESDWYSDAVAWAQANGIANGVTESKFAPNQLVTREQTAAFFYRFVKIYLGQTLAAGTDLSSYQDAGQISDYAKEAMAWANAVGLMEGFGNGYLGPKHQATRVQLAKLLTILHRDISA